MTSIIMARKVTCAYILLFCINGSLANWNDWWTYEGISGPDFWGRLNPGLWGLCSTGRRQSPINIEPQRLLFDPQLQGLQVGKARVRGVLRNTGQGVVFRVETPGTLATDSLGLQSDTSGHMAEHGIGSAPRIELPSVNISGGPLSYSYRVYEIQLHFGRTDHQGSEHLLAGFAFPAEVQIYAYNSVLYANSSEARNRAYGIAAVSIFVKVTRKDAQTRGNGQDGFLKESKMTKPNLDLKMLTDQLQYITYKGDSVPLKALSIYELLPATAALITYEGSLTTPGCEETATWIVLNRPLYMSPSQSILAVGLASCWHQMLTRLCLAHFLVITAGRAAETETGRARISNSSPREQLSFSTASSSESYQDKHRPSASGSRKRNGHADRRINKQWGRR
ncbi:carbonic anhydrase-related protein 10-like isoform X3 [Varroa destructor]|uniref:Alpha-carbonic anhydrase domain-containing protein n=1 Tax=Varroa destructor TaxID=109461 RepID=A0A7M7K5Q7_VARDE|nr:carbonic anhydrase-related protein 10-like isoform X3 [Varroa destructor]